MKKWKELSISRELHRLSIHYIKYFSRYGLTTSLMIIILIHRWWKRQLIKCTKTVLITGGTGGIGMLCVKKFSDFGDKVIVVDINREAIASLKARNLPGVTTIYLDITKESSIQDFANQFRDIVKDDKLDVLINNAGRLEFGPWLEVSPDLVRNVLEVNFFGQFNLIRALMQFLQRASDPRIINVSSQSGLYSQCFLGPYNVSKFAVEAFSDSLRQELKPLNVKVIKIQPGSINTGMVGAAFERMEKTYGSGIFWPRMKAMADGDKRFGSLYAIPAARIANGIFQATHCRQPQSSYPFYTFTFPCMRTMIGLDNFIRLSPTLLDNFWGILLSIRFS